MFDKLQHLNERIARSFAWIGGFALIASSLLVTAEVFLRKFAGFSIGGSDELAGYTLAMVVSLGTGFALLERAHVRIDVLVLMLPKTLRFWAEVLGLVVFLIFLAVLSWFCGEQLLDAIRHDSRSITPLQTPLWIPQAIWVFGLLFALWACTVLAAHTLWRFARGQYDEVLDEMSKSQLEREIEDELRDIALPSDLSSAETK